jgi:hypothetical protein
MREVRGSAERRWKEQIRFSDQVDKERILLQNTMIEDEWISFGSPIKRHNDQLPSKKALTHINYTRNYQARQILF